MDRTAEENTEEWRSAMVDVSDMSLADLAGLVARDADDDTVLGRCLRRLADEQADPAEPIAGFNSAL